MHSLAQKRNISPLNGPILTVQTPASLVIVVREAMIAGGGGSVSLPEDEIRWLAAWR